MVRKRKSKLDFCWGCGCSLPYPISEHICRGHKSVDKSIEKRLEEIKKNRRTNEG